MHQKRCKSREEGENSRLPWVVDNGYSRTRYQATICKLEGVPAEAVVRENFGTQFHVIERSGVIQVTCAQCGKFIAASGSTGPLRVAAAAHACASEDTKLGAVRKIPARGEGKRRS